MKYNNIPILICLALCALSCSKERPSAEADHAIKFNVNYPGTKATASGFEQGDTCGVYMTQYNGSTAEALQVSGNVVNNAALVLSGSTWTLTPKAYWETDKLYDVYAYYPYAAPASIGEYPFSVSLDQNSEDSFEKSDFLWAKTTGVKYPDTVQLTFKHLLSKFVINLVKGVDYEGELPEDAEVWIHNLYTGSYLDLENGVAVKDGKGDRSSVRTHKDATGQYSAVVIPQSMTTRQPVVEIICGDVSYLVETRMTFKSGFQHTLNISLSDNPEKVSIEIGGEISTWN